MKKGRFLKWMGIGVTAGIGIAILAELQKISETSKQQVALLTKTQTPDEAEEHQHDLPDVDACDMEKLKDDESLMD